MNPLVLSEQERRRPAEDAIAPEARLASRRAMVGRPWELCLGSRGRRLGASRGARCSSATQRHQPLVAWRARWPGSSSRRRAYRSRVGDAHRIGAVLGRALQSLASTKVRAVCRRDYRRRRGDRGDGGDGRLSRHAPAADAWMGTGAQQTRHRPHLRRLGAGSGRWCVARAVPSRRVAPIVQQRLEERRLDGPWRRHALSDLIHRAALGRLVRAPAQQPRSVTHVLAGDVIGADLDDEHRLQRHWHSLLA